MELFTFPRDPERRLYTEEDLFRFAVTRVIKRDGLDPETDSIIIADVLAVMEESFANGTVVPIANLN